MYRKDFIPLLLDQPHTLAELAHLLDEPPKDVEDDLHHFLKSIKHMPYHAIIEPARCKQCGFVFHHDKLHKPGKCPECKGTWISEPRISIKEA